MSRALCLCSKLIKLDCDVNKKVQPMSPVKVDFNKVKSTKVSSIGGSKLIDYISECNKKGEYPQTSELYNFVSGKALDAPATSKQWDSFLMGELTTLRNNEILESARYNNTLIWKVRSLK